jgi:hypothetical protein
VRRKKPSSRTKAGFVKIGGNVALNVLWRIARKNVMDAETKAGA